MRIIAIFCLVSVIDCTITFSQVVDKPVPAIKPNPTSKPVPAIVSQPPTEQETNRVFYLRYTKPASAIEMLRKIGPPCQFADDSRLNAVFVRASDEDHKKIEQLLEAIDAPKESREITEVLHAHLSDDREAGGSIISKFAKMCDVEVAFEDGIFVVKGHKDEVTQVTEFINEIIKTSNTKNTENGKLRSYAFRVLWLSNDPVEDSRNVIEPDAALTKSIQRLGELGFANMKVKMQLLSRCDMIQGDGQCQVDGLHLSGNTRRTLNVQAKLAGMGSDPINGKLKLEAGVTELQASGFPPTTSSVEVAIRLEPNKYYILSASPIGGFQTAFVVQLLEDL